MRAGKAASIPWGTHEIRRSNGICRHDPGVDDVLHAQLAPLGADAEGFVAHIAGPTPGGWYVTEVWESKAQMERFMQMAMSQLPTSEAVQPSAVEEFEVYSRQTKDQMVA